MRRHATVSYKERRVEVSVSPLHEGSYIAVVVHDPSHSDTDRWVEYVTDDTRFDDAVSAGVEIAHALIDGQLH